MPIKGAVTMVVGGARGIGKAYATALLKEGAKVVICDMLETLGAETAELLRQEHGSDMVAFVRCDITSDDDVRNAFKVAIDTFGIPEVLVNAAGLIHEGQWRRCVDVNLGGTIRLTNEALKHMSEKNGGKGGVIILTASIAGLKPCDFVPVYSATKFGIVGYTICYGHPDNFAETAVRFNCICPTVVNTEMSKPPASEDVMLRKQKVEGLYDILVDKMLTPDMVAEGLIQLLADDKANGKVMRISRQHGIDYATFPDQPDL